MLQDVAVARYKTFLDVASTLEQLRGGAKHMHSHCSSLQRSLPSLNTAAEAFSQQASQLAAQRTANKLLLSAPLVACLLRECLHALHIQAARLEQLASHLAVACWSIAAAPV